MTSATIAVFLDQLEFGYSIPLKDHLVKSCVEVARAASLARKGSFLDRRASPHVALIGEQSVASSVIDPVASISKIVAFISKSHSVYTARIQVADPANPRQFLAKTNNGGFSTMFPDSWTADRIKVEVDGAFKNKTVVGNKWSGTTSSGVRVEGYLTPHTTVYPKL